jgi:hypothetical protein
VLVEGNEDLEGVVIWVWEEAGDFFWILEWFRHDFYSGGDGVGSRSA